jgi:hypothetical protein
MELISIGTLGFTIGCLALLLGWWDATHRA